MAIRVPGSQPQVEPQALPGIRVNQDAPIEAFGGGQAASAFAGAEKAAKAFTAFQIAEKKKADDVVTADAYEKTVRLKNSLFWDPKEGAMTRTGKAAFGAVEEYSKRFNDGVAEIEKSLANDDQRAVYARIKMQQANDLNSSLQKHVFAESKKFDEVTTTSGIAAAREDAVLNYQDPGKVESNIQLQSALIQAHAARNGLPGEYVKMKIGEATSTTQRAVIERMLANGDDLAASEYYKKIKDQVGAEDAIRLEKTLEEGSLRGNSQRKSDEIVQMHSSLGSALAAAKEIEDPKLRDAVVSRVKDEFSLKEAARRDADEKLSRAAVNIIDQGGSIDDIPPAQLAAMDPKAKNELRTYYKNKVEGHYVPTKPEVYYNLRTMLEDPARRTEAAKYNLLQHLNDVSGDDMKGLINLQAGIRKQDPNVLKQLDGFQSDRNVVDAVLVEAGINPKAKPTSANGQKTARFYQMVDQELIQFQAKTGKKANNDELRKIANRLALEVVTDRGMLWDTKKRAFELEPGEEFEIEVPKADREEITRELQKRGKPVTETEILKWFKRSLDNG